MRLQLSKAIRAYRRNPLDPYSKELLLGLFTEVGLNEDNRNELLAAIDGTLTDNDLDFGELDDAYLAVFDQIAKELQAKQQAQEAAEAEESEEEIEEPAELAGYDKPYLFAGSIQTVQDAKAALDEFVGILHNEGPVKGSGAAQRQGASPAQSAKPEARGKRGPSKGSTRAAAPEMAADTDLATLSDEELRALYSSLRRGPGRHPTSREGYIQKIMEMRAAQVTANPRKGLRVAGNPYLPARGGRALRGYRANPYLPDDQDPLSIYRARLANPGKFPLSPLDHYRAARLLRAHTQGSQNPPDFDLSQIQAIIQVLEPEARAYGSKVKEKVPAPSDRLIASDYEIIQPLSGMVRFSVEGDSNGFLSWTWDRGNFSVLVPWYPAANEMLDKEAARSQSRILFSRPGDQPKKRSELIDIYDFVDALTNEGFGIELTRRLRGEKPIFGFTAEIGAVAIVADALLSAAAVTNEEPLRLFGSRLRQAAQEWGAVNPAVFQGRPAVDKGDSDKLDALLKSLSVLRNQRDTPQGRKTNEFLNNLTEHIEGMKTGNLRDGFRGELAAPHILGAARIIAATKGKPDVILCFPEPDYSSRSPYMYQYNPRPGEAVVYLPPECLPFQLVLKSATKIEFYLGVSGKGGSGGSGYDITLPDAVEWKKGVWTRTKDAKGNLLFAGAKEDTPVGEDGDEDMDDIAPIQDAEEDNEDGGSGEDGEDGEDGGSGKKKKQLIKPINKPPVERIQYQVQVSGGQPKPGYLSIPLSKRDWSTVRSAVGFSFNPTDEEGRAAGWGMTQGFRNLMVSSDEGRRFDLYDLFAPDFVKQLSGIAGAATDRKPKVLRSPYNGGTPYLFLPLVVALTHAVLARRSTPRSDQFQISDELVLALSEGGQSGAVPIGAGRIEDGEATSRITGITVPVLGLPEEVREQIKFLRPAPTFRVVETVMVGNKKKKEVRKPYPYQEVGIAFLHAAGCRAMIGDEMGLGKTIQALGALTLDPSPTTGQPMLPALIIAPASVVGSWVAEVRRWLPHLSVVGVEADTPNEEIKRSDIVVLSWGSVSSQWAKYAGKFSTLIVDEAHYGKRLYKSNKRDGQATLSERFSEEALSAAKEKGGQDRSPYTGRTYGFVRLAHSMPHVFLLSGTLMENGGKDAVNLWTYLYALDPDRFPSQPQFFADYFFGSRSEPVLNKGTIGRFRQLFNSYHIRRMKSTVADQIGLGCLYNPLYQQLDPGCPGTLTEPEIVQISEAGEVSVARNSRRTGTKIRQAKNSSGGYMAVGKVKEIVRADIDLTQFQKAQYNDLLQGMVGQIMSVRRSRAIERVARRATLMGSLDQNALLRALDEENKVLRDTNFREAAKNFGLVIAFLRRKLAEIKLPNAIAWAVDQIQQGEPAIIWVDHQDVLATLASGIQTANSVKGGRKIRLALVSGSTPKAERTKTVKQFQAGELDLIIATQAMREGVTLTRANRALFVEQWWVGAWMSQAEDRIYRIGQKRDCQIYYLIAPGTFDETIWDLVGRKREVQGLVFGSEEFRQGRTTDDGGSARQIMDKTESEDLEEAEDQPSDISILGDRDEEEELDEGEEAAAKAAVARVTEAIIKKLKAEALERELRSVADIQIDVEEVLEFIKTKGIQSYSYRVTPKGKDWKNEYTVLTPVPNLKEALSALPDISVTPSMNIGFSIAWALQAENKPVNLYYMDQYEDGLRGYQALKELSERGLAKAAERVIKKVIRHTQVGPVLTPDEERVLTVIQELSSPTAERVGLGKVFEALSKTHVSADGKERMSVGAVKARLNDLVKKGLVDKFDEGAIRTNGTARARGIRHNGLNPEVARAIMQQPLPAALIRRMQNPSPGVLRSRAVMAAVALLGLPADPNALKFRMAAVDLERAAEAAEDKGVVLPPFVHDALRRARGH